MIQRPAAGHQCTGAHKCYTRPFAQILVHASAAFSCSDSTHQVDQSQPTEDRPVASADWLTGPTVSHESYCACGFMLQNAGLVPPVLLPKGVGTLNAGGKYIGESSVPLFRQS